MVFLDLIDFSSTLIPFFVFRLERALAAVLYFNYCCLLREDRHRDNEGKSTTGLYYITVRWVS